MTAKVGLISLRSVRLLGTSALTFAALLSISQQAQSPFVRQGPKLVGIGAVGSLVLEGASVSLSADRNTAIVGGPYDNSSAGAAWVFFQPPTEDCKNGGWLNFVYPTSPFTFTNQGQCASYFAGQQ
jgi:hypothetical protein